MTPIYNYLIDGDYGLNILVFSGMCMACLLVVFHLGHEKFSSFAGDDDDVCATVGTQDWIWGLGYEVGALRRDVTYWCMMVLA
jgi:hypothetical protein